MMLRKLGILAIAPCDNVLKNLDLTLRWLGVGRANLFTARAGWTACNVLSKWDFIYVRLLSLAI